jgi:hypothetical protein
MKIRFYTPILLVVILIFGCATPTPLRMYQGEKLPKEQVVIITALSTETRFADLYIGSAYVWIIAIDGKSLVDSFWHDLGRRSVEVLPGWHKVDIRFKRDKFVFFGRIHRKVCFEFSAEAGHKYYIVPDSKGGLNIGRSLFVLDGTTGNIVASENAE